MNPPAIWTYLGFVVALLILIWAILETRSRFMRTRRQKMKAETLSRWARMDAAAADVAREEPPPLPEEDNEDQQEKPGQSLRTRAQQNGHYSESKKLL
jgi:hypothetical protein